MQIWWVTFRLGWCGAGILIDVAGFVVLNLELGTCESLNVISFYISLVSLVLHLNYIKSLQACLSVCLTAYIHKQMNHLPWREPTNHIP